MCAGVAVVEAVGGHGGRPNGNGSGSGFGTGRGVNDYVPRSQSFIPLTTSTAANDIVFNNNANHRADTGLRGGVSNTPSIGLRESTLKALRKRSIPTRDAWSPQWTSSNATPTPASGFWN